MFKKILFPTDFSTHAQAELNCLTSFPDVDEIVLLNIVKKYPVPMAKVMIKEVVAHAMQGYLDDAKQYLEILKPDITVTLEIAKSSDIAGVILKTAVKHEVDLIVISGYVRSFKAGVLLGRVPATVLCRISSTNVLVMPNCLIDALAGETYTKFCQNIFLKILCPTDFSELSLKAIACAGKAKGVREIILMHVLPDKVNAETQKEVKTRLAAIQDSLADKRTKVRTLIVDGEPAREISRVAEAENVSVIWMSPSGKGCLVEFLSGSLVHDIIMNGKRPALILRSSE